MRDVKLETGRGIGLVVFLPPKGPRGSNGAYSQRMTMMMMMMMMVAITMMMTMTMCEMLMMSGALTLTHGPLLP